MSSIRPAESDDHVVIDAVSKRYGGGTHALDDVSLRIARGEFVVLLGPSGCGKSTLLSIIAGLEQASSGRVGYPSAPQVDHRSTSVAFQDPSLFEWLTVRRNVEVGLEVLKVPAAERRRLSSHALELVGIEDFAEAYPRQLSGGMKQRVGLARAFVNSPQLLIMDEPFSAVDHFTRLRLQNEVLRLREGMGSTVVFVTHDVGEAVYLADRVILLSSRPGRIEREFRVEVEHPRRRFDERLLQVQNEIYTVLGLEQEEQVRA